MKLTEIFGQKATVESDIDDAVKEIIEKHAALVNGDPEQPAIMVEEGGYISDGYFPPKKYLIEIFVTNSGPIDLNTLYLGDDEKLKKRLKRLKPGPNQTQQCLFKVMQEIEKLPDYLGYCDAARMPRTWADIEKLKDKTAADLPSTNVSYEIYFDREEFEDAEDDYDYRRPRYRRDPDDYDDFD